MNRIFRRECLKVRWRKRLFWRHELILRRMLASSFSFINLQNWFVQDDVFNNYSMSARWILDDR